MSDTMPRDGAIIFVPPAAENAGIRIWPRPGHSLKNSRSLTVLPARTICRARRLPYAGFDRGDQRSNTMNRPPERDFGHEIERPADVRMR